MNAESQNDLNLVSNFTTEFKQPEIQTTYITPLQAIDNYKYYLEQCDEKFDNFKVNKSSGNLGIGFNKIDTRKNSEDHEDTNNVQEF